MAGPTGHDDSLHEGGSGQVLPSVVTSSRLPQEILENTTLVSSTVDVNCSVPPAKLTAASSIQPSARQQPLPRARKPSYSSPEGQPQTNLRFSPGASTPRFVASNASSMSYRGLDPHTPHRPLVDLIPDDNLHVDDEDAAFYAKEEDSLIHPEWKALVQRSTSRIPRRVQRYSVLYLVLLVALWVGWKVYFGEQYKVYREEMNAMDTEPEHAYGTNMRPQFKDIIHMKTMDERHLPKDEKRLVFVGDVHGCIDELKALLEQINFKKKNDHLILTGDIVSKGPNSPGVVSFAKDVGASCVRGNHEDKLLLSIAESSQHHNDALPGPDEDPSTTTDFLDEASHSHGDYKLRKLAKQFNKGQIAWLKECPVILKVGKVPTIGEIVVVHAGLVPGINLEDQDPYQCMNMRTINLKTRMPSENRDGTEWEKFWNHQQKKQKKEERTTVIYGHDAKRGKNIQKYSKGLDSGCVRGGELTAMVIDSTGKEEFVSVPCKGYVS